MNDPWLRELRHDLVKRAVWPARDQQAAGVRDAAGLRRGLFELVDAEGEPIDALSLWARLRAAAPPAVPAAALDGFEASLRRAVDALDQAWPAPIDAILGLEPAFAALARSLDR